MNLQDVGVEVTEAAADDGVCEPLALVLVGLESFTS